MSSIDEQIQQKKREISDLEQRKKNECQHQWEDASYTHPHKGEDHEVWRCILCNTRRYGD